MALVWRTGKLQLWRTALTHIAMIFHLPLQHGYTLFAVWQAAISPVVYTVLGLFTWQNRHNEQTLHATSPLVFRMAGRKALPLACRCLSERKARSPGARCPLSVHTLPSAASCFVTQHDSRVTEMGKHSDPQQISLHESRGISYINTGKAINNVTIYYLHYLPARL